MKKRTGLGDRVLRRMHGWFTAPCPDRTRFRNACRLWPALDVMEDRTLLSHLTYHSGPTLANPSVSAIYYGASWLTEPAQRALATQVNGFLGSIVNSAYMDFLASFDPAAKKVGGRGTFDAGVNDVTTLGATVEDHNQSGVPNDPNDIQDMIQSEISHGKISEKDLIFVYVAPTTVVNFHDSDGTLENSANDFLGYHSAFAAADGKPVYYAVMAYPTAPNANLAQWGLNTFQNLTVVTSHELAEAVTDPDTQTGWFDDHPLKAGQGEIGDLGANMADNPAPIDEGGGYDFGVLDGYVVQYEFANDYTPAGFTDMPVIDAPVLPIDGFGLTGTPLPPLAITQILNPRNGSFSGTIATFEDSRSTGSTPTQYSALIDWGDGTSSSGTVVYDASTKVYDVNGSHAYTQAQGTVLPVHVSITDDNGGAASLVGDVTLAASAAGQLDPSFGSQGIVPLLAAADDVITYPDGRFLVSGTHGFGNGDAGSFVQRYAADGRLDPTFGTLGTASPTSDVFAANVHGYALGLEPDGKIYQSVQFNIGPQLFRYNPDGTQDLTFGTAGSTVPLDFNIAGQLVPLQIGLGAMLVLPDGRILIEGVVEGSIGLALFRTNGTLDPSFNGNGTLVVSPDPARPSYNTDTPSGLALENGKILVQLIYTGSDGNNKVLLERLNLDGSPDAEFGSAGLLAPDVSTLQGYPVLGVQPDGMILVVHKENSGDANIVARYNTDGSPDLSFGLGGEVTIEPSVYSGNPFASVSAIVVQPNGKIVLPSFIGQYGSSQPTYPQIIRLNSDGSIDTSFGDAGVSTFKPSSSGHFSFQNIAMQPSGRIIGELMSDVTGPELAGIIGDPVVSFGGATSVSTTAGVSTAKYDIIETAGTATITLQRGGDLSQPLSVPFSTDDSGGEAGVNYTSVNTTVTFAAGSETAIVTIPILNDPNASAPVHVPLRLSTPSGGAILGNVAVGDLQIEPVEGIAITPTRIPSVMQGGPASSFTVVLQSVPTGNVTVPLSVSSTNPAATLSTSALVFTPANALTPQTVTVTAAAGTGTSAAAATVTAGPATSSDPKYNGLAGGTAHVEIYPAGSGAGSIEFAAANFTVDEDAGTAKLTLVRLGGSSGSVSVRFATSDGTYSAAGKYTPLTGSISFGPGVTSKTITINLIDPGHNLQGDQTVNLALSNPTGGAQLGLIATATLTLHDLTQRMAGDFNPGFGSAGTTILSGSPATLSAIVRQSDNKVVSAGTGKTASDGTALVSVWRTDPTGRPDPGFGLQGEADIPFANFGSVKGVLVEPDGKIVVVGNAARPTGGNEFALLRLNADGSLDTSFGQNGLVATSLSPGDDNPLGVFADSDGGLYVVGTADTANDAAQPFVFAHYSSDGSLDIGFGNGGALVIPMVSGMVAAVAQQPDGKWVLVGGGGYDSSQDSYLSGFAIRLNADFTPDATFGTGGMVALSFTEFYQAVAIAPDGKILVAGGGNPGPAAVARLNPDGALDTTFGGGGSVLTVFTPPGGGATLSGIFSTLIVQPGGAILAVGGAANVGSAEYLAEARYLADGTPDPSFVGGGSQSFGIGGGDHDSSAGAVALPGGDIVLASTSTSLPVLTAILAPAPATIIKTTPTLTWSNPADITADTPLGTAQLDATATVPGTFTYSPAAGTLLRAGAHQTLSVTFTPSDTVHYTSATATVAINIDPPITPPTTPTIIWSNPADTTAGTPLGAVQLDATASVAGTFAYSPPAGTVLSVGTGQLLSVTFTPSDTVHYTSATATVAINVDPLITLPRTPTITWSNPADIPAGTPLGAPQLDAAASVAGTFAYSPPAGTVLNAGSGQLLSVTFTPSDTVHYTSATATVAINVDPLITLPRTPTITWSNPADIPAGTPLGAPQLDAAASVAGTFAYSPPAGTVLSVGTGQLLSVTFTPSDTVHYTSATATVAINVDPLITLPATPTITWSNPADIIAGTPLGPAQLDASASVPGAFAYSPAAGTVLSAGAGQRLSVTFTPTDTTHYTPATATAAINVDPPPPTPPHVTAITAGTHSKKGLMTITVSFDEALDHGSATNAGFYSVLGGVTKKKKTVYSKPVPVRVVTAQGNPTVVTLTLAKPFKGLVQVLVRGGILAGNGARGNGGVTQNVP